MNFLERFFFFALALFFASVVGGCVGDNRVEEGLCGDGVLDEGEECDDGNTEPGDGCDEYCSREWEGEYADTVVAAPGVNGDVSDPVLAANGVRGCGEGCGSLDVAQLSLNPLEDSYIILSWNGQRVVNGPGVDFVVFENPFRYFGGGGDGDGGDDEGVRVFMEQMVVFLSRDGENWVPFPHDYTAPDETVYSNNPNYWQGFAGVNPVLFHEESNPVDPFDFEKAGGDHFDLSLLPNDGGEAQAIREEGFVYLKLVSAPAVVNPDTDEGYVKDAISNGGDIDGVYAKYLQPSL